MKIYQRFKFLLPIFVIIILATVGYMFIYAHNPFMEGASVIKTLIMQSNPVGKQAPEISGIESWLNTDGQSLSLEELRGKVVLVDFWTYSCINCQRSLPFLVEWDKKYRDQGLVVIGVHTPEFRFERKLENVMAEVKKYGIEYPVALDNEYVTWRAFSNHYWPAKYLIDKDGQIVYFRFGEGAYDITESKIQELLAEINEPTDS